MSEDKVKKEVGLFIHSVSMEGLAYAIQNYPPGKDAPKDLIGAADEAFDAIENLTSIIEKYMEKYDIEYS